MNKILFKTYTDALSTLIDTVKSRKIDLETRHIVVVPDKYTLEVERRIYGNTTGAFDCDVVTLNRLFLFFDDTQQSLSKKACVMLIKKLCLQCGFRAFRRSAKFSSFAERIYDTIQMLKSCNISANDLSNLSVYEGLKIKLDDIALVYHTYQQVLQDRFIDGGDKYALLKRKILSSDVLHNSIFYFANFDYFTPAMSDIIDAIDQKASSCSLYMLDPKKQNFTIDSLEIYQASSNVDQIKSIARRIKVDIMQGVRYKDIGIICKQNQSLLRRIFDEYNIPVNIDIQYDLSTFPLSVWIMELFEICGTGLQQNNILSLSKNYFASLSQAELLAFCDFVQKYAINFNGFLQKFDNPLAENARVKIIAQYQLFYDSVYNSPNALAFCQNLQFYLDECTKSIDKLDQLVGDTQNKDINIDVLQVANHIYKLLDDLSLVVDTKDSTALGIACFLDSIKSQISILPPLYDAVTVGDEKVLRGSIKQKIYICELNEGVLPSITYDSGIITDTEISHMQANGIHLKPTTKDVNQRAKTELIQVVYSGSQIVCAFVANNDNKPSFLLERFKQSVINPNNILLSSYLDEITLLNESNHLLSSEQPNTTINEIHNTNSNTNYPTTFSPSKLMQRARHLHFSSVVNAKELLFSNQLKDHTTNSSLYFALHSIDDTISKYIYQEQELPISKARELFFPNHSVSVSRIERYYTCAFWHFLQYGLQLKKQEIGSTAPNDIGSFLHKVLELFVINELDIERLDDLIDQTLVQKEFYKLNLDTNKLAKHRAISEAKKVCTIAKNQLSASNFEPYGAEVKFGKDQPIQGFNLDGIDLVGVIDRVDTHQNNVRLIDYKSGNITFKYQDIFLGKKLQLVAYLSVLSNHSTQPNHRTKIELQQSADKKQNNNAAIVQESNHFNTQLFSPAGSFYFPIQDRWDDDEFSHRLVGLYKNDLDIILNMDTTLSLPQTDPSITKVKSEIIDATTQITKSKGFGLKQPNKNALNKDQMDTLFDYTYQMLLQSIHQVRNGNISKSPLGDSQSISCDYCPYNTICTSSGQSIDKRILGKTIELEHFI